MDQNVQNGLPPIQKNHINGLGSSQSSRDSSPISRFSNMPPNRAIPASQLPPISGLSPIVKSGLNTPQSSPGFSTSTPNTGTDGHNEPIKQGQISQPLLPVRPNFNQNLPRPNYPMAQNIQMSQMPVQRVMPPMNKNAQTQNDFKPVAQNQFSSVPNYTNFSKPLPQYPDALNDFKPVNQYPPNVAASQTSQFPSNVTQGSQFPTSQFSQFPSNQINQSLPNAMNQGSVSVTNQVSQVSSSQMSYFHPNQGQLPATVTASQVMNQAGQLSQGITTSQIGQLPSNAPSSQVGNFLPNSTNLKLQYTDIKPSQISPFPVASINPPKPQYGMGPQIRPQNSEQRPNIPRQSDLTQPPINVAQKFVQMPTNNMNQRNLEQTAPSYPVNTPPANQYQSSIHAKKYPQPYQNYAQTNQPATNLVSPTSFAQPSYQQNAYAQAGQRQDPQNLNQQMANLNVTQSGYNKLWGNDNYELLSCPNILPQEALQPPRVRLGQEFLDAANCSPEIFRCTMTKIPETNSLLLKSRLPLGVLIHPFKDLNHLPVIQCNTIVRCRACRTYINPFVFFVDAKRWKCNLCYRVNELPEEFQYDPVSKSYGDPSRRPEIKSSTIEYIAPSEYMLRPPQPAVYLFLLDISRMAIETGYLKTVCEVLSSQLSTLPGDARTQIGFVAYNSTLHFFSLAEGLNQPHEMTVMDIDDVFLPCPDNLLVNLKESKDLVSDLLAQLPTRFMNSYDTGSALGAALQVALKMMSSTGGRVTVFQTRLPTLGPGALAVREDPNQRSGKEAMHLNPATDFYKRLALDCSGHQIAVDLFILNSQYVDIATLSGISRFSGGCMHHFPLFKGSRTLDAESLEKCFRRYLTRKIGFEAVMRIRCTRGLAIHTFHGNFFVRSTDLLSLPNVNPDAGFGMQLSIEESLSELHTVCFQAALLYTSSKGERRIRVHTLCLPVVSSLTDVLNSADQQCIVGLLAKMAADRSQQSSLSDARDAFINVAIDILSSYKVSLNMGNSSSGLFAPESLKLLPLYILALLKYVAFRTGQSTRLDDRVFAMCEMKTLPLVQLLQNVYPDLYPIHSLTDEGGIIDPEGTVIPQPPRLQLTSRIVDANGAYLLDAGHQMIILVCQNVSPMFLTHVLGVPNYPSISDQFYELPKIENPDNQRLHALINGLNDEKPYCASLQIMRENSPNRLLFFERLIEDRIESALSYNEFLQHIKTQVK